MSKTITFFTCGGLEEPSGIGRYAPLAKELTKRGFHINYLALHPDYRSLKTKSFQKDGFNVYYVGQMHVLKKGSKKYYFNKWQLFKIVFISTIKMILTALSLKSDILYCFKPQPINGFAALVTKLIKQKPLLLDCEDYEAELNRLTKFQKKIFILFEDNLPRFAKYVTFHTQFLKERYINLGFASEKFVLLPNGVDKERFAQLDENKIDQYRQTYKLQNKKVILYCGSLSLKSGHAIDLLLKAFHLIKQRVPNSVLLIIGGGEDIDSLKMQVVEEVRDSVFFIGRVPPEEIPCYIKLADVTVDPVNETLANWGRSPLKIFESLAVGVPVVTSNIGDRRLIIETNKAGILVKVEDYEDLAKGCCQILSNKALAQQMSKECLRIIKKYYWNTLADKLITDIPLLLQ